MLIHRSSLADLRSATVDTEYTDIVKAALKKTSRRRYGYFPLARQKVLLYL